MIIPLDRGVRLQMRLLLLVAVVGCGSSKPKVEDCTHADSCTHGGNDEIGGGGLRGIEDRPTVTREALEDLVPGSHAEQRGKTWTLTFNNATLLVVEDVDGMRTVTVTSHLVATDIALDVGTDHEEVSKFHTLDCHDDICKVTGTAFEIEFVNDEIRVLRWSGPIARR